MRSSALQPSPRRRYMTVLACLVTTVAASPARAQDLSDSASVDLLAAAKVEIVGGSVGGGFAAIKPAGDVNGDGRADVIVTTPWASHNGRELSGSVYVIFGHPTATTVDVSALGTHGFRIDGRQGYSHELGRLGSGAGRSAAAAGDVNGDGLDDVIIGAPDDASGWSYARYGGTAGGEPQPTPGSAFVIFGTRSPSTIDLAALGSAGFEIVGPLGGTKSGTWVDGVGDVNGDGLDDVALDSLGASVEIVFGKAPTATVQLESHFGPSWPVSYGYRIIGDAPHEPMWVEGVGDVNADGRGDVVVGGTEPWQSDSVTTSVVFGKASGTSVYLEALGSGGFAILGHPARAAGNGDVNGDGRDDILLGDPNATYNGPDSGSVWVVFGKSSTTAIDVAALGTAGFRIDGKTREGIGSPKTIVPDLNADGRDEIFVGAPAASRNGRSSSGSAYLVFGRTSTTKVNLAMLGPGGFRIDGASAGARAGGGVGAVGDFAGDARPELAVMGVGFLSLVNAPALVGLSTTSGPPTTVVRLSGSFFAPDERVDISFDGAANASAAADSGGNLVNVRVTVPSSALPGVHTFRAVGAASGLAAQALFLVRTSWTHAAYGATRTGFNPYENILGRSTVAGLQPLWAGSPAGPFAGSPLYVAGYVHVASTGGVVSTLDPVTGALLWSKPVGGTIASGPASANSTVYVGASDGKVYALDKRFGAQRWVKATGGAVISSPAVAQSVVYVHSTDGYVYALDANNGSQRWKVYVGPNAGASPAVSSSRVHVVTGADVIALAPATGSRLWTTSLPGAADLATPVASGSYVYVGSGPSAVVRALTASTGAVRWSRALAEAATASVSSLVVGEGVVYAQTPGSLHAVNAADGLPRFTRTGAGAASAGQPFTLANHVLYLPGPRALNASTGALLWSGGDGTASASVADGVLFAGVHAYRLP